LLDLELACESALKPALLRAAGSFSPKNDGPLMTGAASDTGAEVRGCAEAEGAEEGGADDRVAAPCATGSDAGNSVAPHMPQKRFVSVFSLPQRGQRTDPPALYSIAYDIFEVRCSPNATGVSGK
jgi:hypothetical protein